MGCWICHSDNVTLRTALQEGRLHGFAQFRAALCVVCVLFVSFFAKLRGWLDRTSSVPTEQATLFPHARRALAALCWRVRCTLVIPARFALGELLCRKLHIPIQRREKQGSLLIKMQLLII